MGAAVLWVISSSAAFTIMNAVVKLLHRLPTWEIVFFRSFTNVLWLTPFIIRHPVKEWKKEYKVLLMRGIAGGISMVLFFYAISGLKLADAVMLNYSSSIPVLILSALFLGERLSAISIVFILIAILGVGLILKPGFQVANLPGIAGITSAFVAAVAYTSIKAATRKLPSHYIVFTFATIVSLMSIIPMLFVFITPTTREWLLLIGAGSAASYAQYAMTKGYAGLPASLASPLSLTAVLFATLLGWVLFAETPDPLSALGGTLMVLGLIGAYRFR